MADSNDQDPVDALFKALASQPRRRILDLLAASKGEYDKRCCGPYDVCACGFAEQLGLTASTISHHMRVLIDAGLVSSEKRGLWVFYRLRAEGVRQVLDTLAPLRDADLECCAARLDSAEFASRGNKASSACCDWAVGAAGKPVQCRGL